MARRIHLGLRLIALAMIAALLTGAASADFALYRCLLSGDTETECCCHGERAHHEYPAMERSCCAIERVVLAHAPSETARAKLQATPVLLGLSALDRVAPRASSLTIADRDPLAGAGPPLRLKHHQLLI